jgi:2-oxoisovalerate dehydrogenase E2 component (dihydrolipoyl transacylase)
MVVVPPQVAILGAGRLFSRLTLNQGLPGTGRILPLSLTFDHRAVTGVEACRFLAAVVDDLQSPV